MSNMSKDKLNIGQKGIDRKLSEHKLWLTSMGRHGGRADFSNIDLEDANFAGADLRYIDFSNCNLSNVNFMNADLRHAIFGLNSNLCHARNIHSANMDGAFVVPIDRQMLIYDLIEVLGSDDIHMELDKLIGEMLAFHSRDLEDEAV